MRVSVVSPLDHGPVSAVAIHGDGHTPAARCDSEVRSLVRVVDLGQNGFGGFDVPHGRARVNVAAVVENVHGTARYASIGSRMQQGVEVIGMGVDVAVGVQPQEVEGVIPPRCNDIVPGITRKDRSLGDGLVHELGTLGEDATGTERIVADLAVSHIAVGGKPDGGTMCT